MRRRIVDTLLIFAATLIIGALGTIAYRHSPWALLAAVVLACLACALIAVAAWQADKAAEPRRQWAPVPSETHELRRGDRG